MAQPWTDETLYFIRTTTKSTLVALAANIQVPAAKWKGRKLDQSTEVVNGVASSVEPGEHHRDPGRGDLRDQPGQAERAGFSGLQADPGVLCGFDRRLARQAQPARRPLRPLVADRLHGQGGSRRRAGGPASQAVARPHPGPEGHARSGFRSARRRHRQGSGSPVRDEGLAHGGGWAARALFVAGALPLLLRAEGGGQCPRRLPDLHRRRWLRGRQVQPGLLRGDREHDRRHPRGDHQRRDRRRGGGAREEANAAAAAARRDRCRPCREVGAQQPSNGAGAGSFRG